MKQAAAIFWEELKESVKTKKIILMFLMALFIIISIYTSGFIQVAYLLFFRPQNMIPFPISITYYLLFFTIPVFVLLLGHDTISSEIENFSIRGVISKIKRSSFILGKSLSVFMIISSLSFILLLSSLAYTAIKLSQVDIIHPLIFFLYLLPYIAALTSASVFFSSLFSKSSTSLLIIILFYIVLLYLNSGFFAFVSIFHYMGNIMLSGSIIAAIIAFISYALIFTASTLLIFGARDL